MTNKTEMMMYYGKQLFMQETKARLIMLCYVMLYVNSFCLYLSISEIVSELRSARRAALNLCLVSWTVCSHWDGSFRIDKDITGSTVLIDLLHCLDNLLDLLVRVFLSCARSAARPIYPVINFLKSSELVLCIFLEQSITLCNAIFLLKDSRIFKPWVIIELMCTKFRIPAAIASRTLW